MITSLSNTRIKEARKLSDRRVRYQSQRLLIEGVRLIHDAWQSGAVLEVVFYTAEATDNNPALGKLVELLSAQGIECVPCTPSAFSSLSETVTPQGVAAITPLSELAIRATPTLVLLLDQVRDPGNAGSLLRSAEAAGVELVFFGPGTVDPFNEKVVRAGMGAHFRLPLRLLNDWAQLGDWLPATLPLFVAEASAALSYDRVDWSIPAGLVVGGEATGASAALRTISTPIAIPMHGKVESLNAAMAGSVILFEAARQRRHYKT